MKLTYIYHSCYCIEGENFVIIIDFYKDTDDNDGYIYQRALQGENKRVYVLCTHSHLDHFNGEILNWKYKVNDIRYIFSKEMENFDISRDNKDIIFLDKLEEFKDELLFVKAYGSTDIGGSFYIEAEDKKIFHAGDLNNWHWNEESNIEEIREAEEFYSDELDLLNHKVKNLDFAMFPIDPRLGKDFMKGAQQFIETIDVKLLAPMHFGDNYDKVALFGPIAEKNNCKYLAVKKKGQSITV